MRIVFASDILYIKETKFDECDSVFEFFLHRAENDPNFPLKIL